MVAVYVKEQSKIRAALARAETFGNTLKKTQWRVDVNTGSKSSNGSADDAASKYKATAIVQLTLERAEAGAAGAGVLEGRARMAATDVRFEVDGDGIDRLLGRIGEVESAIERVVGGGSD